MSRVGPPVIAAMNAQATGDAFARLGPRARDALRRATLNALLAGRAGPQSAAQQQMHFEYALNLIETAMIVDAAEAQQAGRTDG
jgi:hypothetical protein